VFISSIAFDGVDQTGGATSFPNSTSSTSATTLSVLTAVGNIVVCCGSSTVSLGTISGTTIFLDQVSGAVINAFANYDSGTGSISIGSSSGPASRVATNVKAG
jgi:hypothetical protein